MTITGPKLWRVLAVSLVALLAYPAGPSAAQNPAPSKRSALGLGLSKPVLRRNGLVSSVLGCWALYDSAGAPAAKNLYWAASLARLDRDTLEGPYSGIPGAARVAVKLESTGQPFFASNVDRRHQTISWTADSLADTIRVMFSSGFSGTSFVFGIPKGDVRTDTLRGRAIEFFDVGPSESDAGRAHAIRVECAKPPPPAARYAAIVEAILAAWKTADVVCLGEDHGRQYDSDLRIALVRHPAFPKTVRAIVVESANPIHQDRLDRFILDGAPMSREQLAPIWRDASGAQVWESPIYEEFLRAVRDVNLKLPREQRVRVLGGDTRIDWTTIQTAAQLAPLMNRGGNIRNIISKELLDPRIKGLAIYGARHCDKVGGGFPGDLWGKYATGRMWSVEPFVGRKGAEEARKLFGFGNEPGYLAVVGTKAAFAPAGDLLVVNPKWTLGDITDAVVYHGNVPDSVVRADLTTLNAKYGPELARRSKLTREAYDLLQGRKRNGPISLR
jgi:hypothetical protein